MRASLPSDDVSRNPPPSPALSAQDSAPLTVHSHVCPLKLCSIRPCSVRHCSVRRRSSVSFLVREKKCPRVVLDAPTMHSPNGGILGAFPPVGEGDCELSSSGAPPVSRAACSRAMARTMVTHRRTRVSLSLSPGRGGLTMLSLRQM